MHSSAPQQSSPLAVAHGAPALPQQTWPSEVVPHVRPEQHPLPEQGRVAVKHVDIGSTQ
jgi:hypothetical protein